MADTPIPVADLPSALPGPLDSFVGVDESTKKPRRFAIGNVPIGAGVYISTEAGLTATTTGQYFSVPSAESDEYLILYKNDAGSAVEVKRYPTFAAIDAAETRAALSASTAEAVAGPTYASVAAGEAATTTGQSFAVDNGDGTVSIYLRTSGGSTLQRTLATTAALAASTGSSLVGYGAGTVKDALDNVAAMDAAHEARESAREYSERFARYGAQPVKSCVMTRLSSTLLRVLRPLGGPFWMDMRLSTGGISSGPYSWNETYITEIYRFITATDSACGYTGTWTNSTSGNPTSYVGGTGKTTTNPTGAQYIDVSVTLNSTSDLYVIYTARTTGGYIKVEIDGSTEAASLLPSNGTYRYIDTYSSVDLQYKQPVMIASGVTAGSHTIRLTATSDKNAAVTGTRQVVFEAVAVCGDSDGIPGTTGTDASLWQATTAYAQYAQIRTTAGRYYYASVAGTTGSAEPTHTSGTATDGTVTWTYMASSSYTGKQHKLQSSGSQLEYAYEFKPTGASSFEDMGGIVHGNEELLSISIALDGLRIPDISTGAYASARSIQIMQSIKATHSYTGTSAVNSTVLTHNIDSRGVRVANEHVWGAAGQVGFFYPAMWPLNHWDAANYKYGVTQLWTPQGGEKSASDYYGQSNPIVGKTLDYIMGAKGDVLAPNGSAGVASTVPARYGLLAWLQIDPASVNSYTDAGSVYAGMAMNIAGTTAPGYSSVVSKMYFERSSTAKPTAVEVGEKWTSSAFYGLQLVPTTGIQPWT